MTSRRYAHIYYCHFERMSALGAEPHLNTCFKHYMFFVYEFNLIPKREELAPLQELIDKLLERDAGGAARGATPTRGGAGGAGATCGACGEGAAAPPPPPADASGPPQLS